MKFSTKHCEAVYKILQCPLLSSTEQHILCARNEDYTCIINNKITNKPVRAYLPEDQV